MYTKCYYAHRTWDSYTTPITFVNHFAKIIATYLQIIMRSSSHSAPVTLDIYTVHDRAVSSFSYIVFTPPSAYGE